MQPALGASPPTPGLTLGVGAFTERTMTTRLQILTRISNEDGQIEPLDLIGMITNAEATAIYVEVERLRKEGHILPERYRPIAHDEATNLTEREKRVIAVLEKDGPRLERSLAVSVGGTTAAGDVDSDFAAELRQMGARALISPPNRLWISPTGLALLEAS